MEDPYLLGAASLSGATLFPDSESIGQALATRDLLPLISRVRPWRTLGRCAPPPMEGSSGQSTSNCSQFPKTSSGEKGPERLRNFFQVACKEVSEEMVLSR